MKSPEVTTPIKRGRGRPRRRERDEDVLSVCEAAARLGLSRAWLGNLIKRGVVPCVVVLGRIGVTVGTVRGLVQQPAVEQSRETLSVPAPRPARRMGSVGRKVSAMAAGSVDVGSQAGIEAGEGPNAAGSGAQPLGQAENGADNECISRDHGAGYTDLPTEQGEDGAVLKRGGGGLDGAVPSGGAMDLDEQKILPVAPGVGAGG